MHFFDVYTEILEDELKLAMGCTEPIAIAYAASILCDALGDVPRRVEIALSGNIIKNVKSVIVPATEGMHGIEAAVAAGLVAKAPERELEVLTALGKEDACRIDAVVKSTEMHIHEIETEKPFEVKLSGFAGERTAFVHLADRHTNVVSVLRGQEDLTKAYRKDDRLEEKESARKDVLNVADIIEYADTVPLEKVRSLILRQVESNMAIAQEGLRGDWGASIGKMLYNEGDCSVETVARAMAAAGSDARMSGCEMPVCILSGSGNQGICASVPVVVFAREKQKSEEEMIRALLVADLITIHQKTGIGCLSAYCGAVSAGCGCAAGLCYLHGGRLNEVSHTLVNAVAILSGMICDGAKPSCAAKIAMAVEAGLMGLHMTESGKEFLGGDGIVTKGVENTIQNVGRLARQGMRETDKEIIRIMLGQQ